MYEIGYKMQLVRPSFRYTDEKAHISIRVCALIEI